MEAAVFYTTPEATHHSFCSILLSHRLTLLRGRRGLHRRPPAWSLATTRLNTQRDAQHVRGGGWFLSRVSNFPFDLMRMQLEEGVSRLGLRHHHTHPPQPPRQHGCRDHWAHRGRMPRRIFCARLSRMAGADEVWTSGSSCLFGKKAGRNWLRPFLPFCLVRVQQEGPHQSPNSRTLILNSPGPRLRETNL